MLIVMDNLKNFSQGKKRLCWVFFCNTGERKASEYGVVCVAEKLLHEFVNFLRTESMLEVKE